MKTFGALAALILTLAAPVRGVDAAPVVISTLPDWNGTSSIGDFGSAGFSGWGQFLRAPTGTNRLLDFTFLLSDAIQGTGTTPVPVEFQAHLVEYNPTTRRVVGPTLYTSAAVTVPLTDGLVFKEYSFAPDVAVTAGSTYMMFLFANNFALQIPRDSRLRLATVGTNVGGAGWNIPFLADSDLSGALAGHWRFTANEDLAFSATFENRPVVAVPEPAGLALVAAAGGAALWVSRRRRPVGSE